MEYPSYYDIDRLFLHSVTARDIADSLRSFDSCTPADVARADMDACRCEVAGVRVQGYVTGYLLRDELGAGVCGDYARPLESAVVVSDSTQIIDLIKALHEYPWVLVKMLGRPGGILTRADLQDPPVRMWLFGFVTAVEMRFLKLIEEHYTDESWMQYLSEARVTKAQEMLAERQRRNQSPTLLDCLQFSDKGQIVARNETLRVAVGFVSRRRADEAVKRLEALRNNLAHAQAIVDLDWDTIVAIAENLERVIGMAPFRQ
jgi:hypothetical protein